MVYPKTQTQDNRCATYSCRHKGKVRWNQIACAHSHGGILNTTSPFVPCFVGPIRRFAECVTKTVFQQCERYVYVMLLMVVMINRACLFSTVKKFLRIIILSVDPVMMLTDDNLALSQLFARHQEALVMRSWARAARLLDHYRKRLQFRILLEERHLLPYCVGEKLPGQWHIYISEHRRLEDALNNANKRLAVARRRGITAAVLIALLDEEKTLKYNLEHHLHREETEFSTTLQQSLPMDVGTRFVRALIHPSRTEHPQIV